jgi:hypothetical protein
MDSPQESQREGSRSIQRSHAHHYKHGRGSETGFWIVHSEYPKHLRDANRREVISEGQSLANRFWTRQISHTSYILPSESGSLASGDPAIVTTTAVA